MNLIEAIQEAIREDDADTEKQSEILENLYNQSSDLEKQAIDDAVICLSGWSLETLLGRVDA